MASDLEALARAKYKIPFYLPDVGGADMIMTPTNVSISQGGSVVIISGTYALDETFFTEEPGSLLLPPLRWKLVLGPNPDDTFAEFIYEFVAKEL